MHLAFQIHGVKSMQKSTIHVVSGATRGTRDLLRFKSFVVALVLSLLPNVLPWNRWSGDGSWKVDVSSLDKHGVFPRPVRNQDRENYVLRISFSSPFLGAMSRAKK